MGVPRLVLNLSCSYLLAVGAIEHGPLVDDLDELADRPEVSVLQRHAMEISDTGQAQRTARTLAERHSRSWRADRGVRQQSEAPEAKAKRRAAPGSEMSTNTISVWATTAVVLLGAASIIGLARPSFGQRGLPKYVAEFAGTYILVYSVGCNVLIGDSTWGVISVGCTLMVAMYAIGNISGGYLNPAVTLAVALTQKLSMKDLIIYILVQFAAGIAAGLTYGLVIGQTFSLSPTEGYTLMEAGLAEIFYTFMIAFVVLNTHESKDHAGKGQFYGLATGFSVVAGGYGAGMISGGYFNPAVALGVDSSGSGQGGFGWCLTYFVFEFMGAALAAVLFRACRPGDFTVSRAEMEGEEEELQLPPPLPSRLLSEFLGTFMVVLTVGLNVLAQSKAAVFSIAAALMSMTFALGTVSGAHFNPAVTVAVHLSGRGKINWAEVAAYITAQIIAGLVAAFTYVAMQSGRSVSLKPSGSTGEALYGEFVFTFFLSYALLSVWTVISPLSQYFGLAIGSCFMAGGLAIGSSSGSALNPAISIGLALSDLINSGSVAYMPSYASVELLGGVLAALTFRQTHYKEYAAGK